MKRFSLLPIVFALLMPLSALAQVPSTISYQGRMDSAGVPIKSPKSLTFAIYDAATGGTAIWTETQPDVPFMNGMFSVKLGSVTPFPGSLCTSTGERWLGVNLAGGTEMVPRFLFTSAPFAIRALHADNVADSAITSAKIPGNQVVKALNGLRDDVELVATGGATVNASGNTITINAGAGSTGGPITGIQNTNNTLDVTDPAGPTVTINVKNGGITGTQLAENAVSGTKIAAGQVVKGVNGLKDNIWLAATGGATVNSSGDTITINAGAGSTGGPITGIQNTNNTLDVLNSSGPTVTINLKNAGVTGNQLADNSVGSIKVIDGTIGTSDLAADAVTSATVADGSIATADLADGAVNSLKITDSTIVTADLVDAAVTGTKIADGAVTSPKVGFPLEYDYVGTNGYELHYGLGYSWRVSLGYNNAGLYAKYRRGTGLTLGTGYALYVDGNTVITGGSLTVSPTSTNWTTNKPATVKMNDGSTVRLFSEEAAEVYFTDYGSSHLVSGKAHVELEPRFLQTVTVDGTHPMKVFVQLEGDCLGVYVANKNATSFDVVELQGGTSDAPFTYRVVCKRRYYEDERLASPEQDKLFNERMLREAWPELSGSGERTSGGEME